MGVWRLAWLGLMIAALEQPGYLTRETDSNDQRFKRIHLTPRGHAATKAIREIVGEVEAEWQQQLGPRRFAQLHDLLAQLYTTARADPGG